MARREKFMTAESAVEWVQHCRKNHQTIVFTNGCFDILHRGHVDYLEYARSLGEVLVVAVNSDESIRQVKGTSRPINTLEDRLCVLAGLEAVSCLIPFEELTPEHLVASLQPDIYVKGGDYRMEELPEKAIVEAYGGVVRLAPWIAGKSTTDLVQKIRLTGSLP